MPIKVLIADDHVFYREGVRAFLSNAPEIEVIGEASNGDEAIAKASRTSTRCHPHGFENARHERHRCHAPHP